MRISRNALFLAAAVVVVLAAGLAIFRPWSFTVQKASEVETSNQKTTARKEPSQLEEILVLIGDTDVVLAQVKAYERAVEFTKVFPAFQLGSADPEGKTEVERRVIEAGKDIPGSIRTLSDDRDKLIGLVLTSLVGIEKEKKESLDALRAELAAEVPKFERDRKRLEKESAAADLTLFRALKAHAAAPTEDGEKQCLALFETAVEKASHLVQCDLRLDWVTMLADRINGKTVTPAATRDLLAKRTLKY